MYFPDERRSQSALLAINVSGEVHIILCSALCHTLIVCFQGWLEIIESERSEKEEVAAAITVEQSCTTSRRKREVAFVDDTRGATTGEVSQQLHFQPHRSASKSNEEL